MGKHDINYELIAYKEQNEELRKRLNRAQRVISEIEARAEDKITALEEENAMLRQKITKLVETYV